MIDRIRQFVVISKRDLLFAVLPAVTLGVLALMAVYHFVDPAPPNRLVMSTGEAQSAYQDFGRRYQEILSRDGVQLELRTSAGAVENLQRLREPNGDVDVALVQDGLHTEQDGDTLLSLGSMYYEPLWVFYRGKQTLTRLNQLAGKRVSIGREGGGTRRIALQLLHLSGVTERNTKLLALRSVDGAAALARGEVDAAFFIGTPDSDFIEDSLHHAGIKLMSLEHAEAYTRRLPFLHALTLPRGTIDLVGNIPPDDARLVGVTSTLIVRDELHPALKYLLLKAAKEVHGAPDLFAGRNQFPSGKDADFPMAEEATHFYKSGPPLLQRYLPFWAANFFDRMLVVLVPLLAFLIPLTRIIPLLYSWRIRRRIYRWYGELKFLETQVQADAEGVQRAEHRAKLELIEDRVNGMRLPLAFSDHLYVLREHVDLVRRRLARLQESTPRPAPAVDALP
jgi:TRAP transporter TAXI family solute receptor